ncbi:hypothetical protein LCGC14_0016620 [marine sediment metagenome]|uniref:dTDP-4-dehydrorhamnose 3,5-epimerase n=1 Tax=marine sediment metagenome TaxID=412755 RepID=A0A0F9W1J8_9ZZZZ|nr:dTDP-4-dehydrorhamnose 3,5-epimerase [Phycisphaerae bacterium]HDZ42370.1 dTDP-4-dehydrorhamnose 3,5-epimerase [Phycisphaerae bacterium]
MMRTDTSLPGVCVLQPVVHPDGRGYFLETYNQRTFNDVGIESVFVQDNESCSQKGVLRGLHYQLAHPQTKLVRVLAGEIFDVAVDVRRGSPTFGRWVGETLSAENKKMLLVPEGFAHGFLVMRDMTQVAYKCSDFYAPAEERGVIWNDPVLAIAWPLEGDPILSDKDRAYDRLADCDPEQLPIFGEGGS